MAIEQLKGANMKRDEIINTSVKAVAEFVGEFCGQLTSCHNPIRALDLIYEDDIKSEMYHRIKTALNGARSENTNWCICEEHSRSTLSVQLLHCEQYMRGSHVDIAIWDPEHPDNNTLTYKEKRCCLFIELKQKCRACSALCEITDDIEKIKLWQLDNNQIALALAFCTDRADLIKSRPNFRFSDHVLSIEEMKMRMSAGRHAFIICCDGCKEIESAFN